MRAPLVDLADSLTATRRVGATELYRAHAKFVAGFLSKMGVQSSDLDDLVQDVFVIAHRRGGFETGTARPTTWLARIAINEFRNYRRRMSTRNRYAAQTAQHDTDLADPAPDGHALLEARDRMGRVNAALAELDDGKRAVFLLYELGGERCDDIAQALGIPVGTVYSRLHAARQELRAAYERMAQ